jgi:hypothetical protein
MRKLTGAVASRDGVIAGAGRTGGTIASCEPARDVRTGSFMTKAASKAEVERQNKVAAGT